MKPFYIAFLSITFLFSCNDSDKEKVRYVPESVGNLNSLQIVIESDLWSGEMGEKIRDIFAAPTDGLPQLEPLYSMIQLQPDIYNGFARKYRLFLHTTIADKDTMYIKKDPFAKPQAGVFITATSEENLVNLLEKNKDRILGIYQKYEIREAQRRINLSLMRMDSLPERFGVSLDIPSAYRFSSVSDDFYWIRKDLKSGSTNIIIYEVPISNIDNDSTVISNIIKMRDSAGGGYLPVEDDGQFITTTDYAPYLFTTEIDGMFAYETKGVWEVKDQYMGGPFLNYAIKDEPNNRYLIIEGFSYAPSMTKRNLQFELEAILKSATIQ